IYPNLPRPKQFWGVSDIEPLREPLAELNRALTQLSRILELSGNPIAVLENVEEARDIAVQPGAVWELPEQARAYLLDLLQGGGAGLHLEFTNLLRTFHDLAEGRAAPSARRSTRCRAWRWRWSWPRCRRRWGAGG